MGKEQIIYGIRAILEAIEAEQPINKVYLQKGLSGALLRELETTLRKKKLNISYVPIERLNRFTSNNHQGAVAAISPVSYHNFEALTENIINAVEHPLFLLLDQISDVRNFGAIIRTAECCGVDAIIIPKTGSAPTAEMAPGTGARVNALVNTASPCLMPSARMAICIAVPPEVVERQYRAP